MITLRMGNEKTEIKSPRFRGVYDTVRWLEHQIGISNTKRDFNVFKRFMSILSAKLDIHILVEGKHEELFDIHWDNM